MKENPPRIHEIDILRGLAVTAMIYYHLIYDLVFFYGKPFDLNQLRQTVKELVHDGKPCQ